MKKIIFAILLILLGILFRTTLHIGPNVEFVTAGAILAALYLGRWYAILIPLIIMIISDKIIGNTSIYMFTWSAYLLIGMGVYILNKVKRQNAKGKNTIQNSKLFFGLEAGVFSALFFYLFTNFGVWALDSWGMYSRDLTGLVRCYYMGLPFLKFNLIGNLIFIPVSIFVIEKIKSFLLAKKTSLEIY